jgi:hypothetical protein
VSQFLSCFPFSVLWWSLLSALTVDLFVKKNFWSLA